MTQIKQIKTKRLMLSLLVAVFVLPILLAKIMVDSGLAKTLPTGKYGISIEPPFDLSSNKKLRPLAKNGLLPSEWLGLYFNVGSCEKVCREKVTALQSVKKVLGKDYDRFKVGIFSSQASTSRGPGDLVTLVGGISEVKELVKVLDNRINIKEDQSPDNGVVLIDWRGYMMLYYPELDLNGFKKDISKLLRGSRIR